MRHRADEAGWVGIWIYTYCSRPRRCGVAELVRGRGHNTPVYATRGSSLQQASCRSSK